MESNTVLLVDDNTTFLPYARRFIEMDTALEVVGSATDGEEALRLTRTLQPQVIVLDLSMPGRGGLELMPDLRRAAPSASIVVLSSLEPEVYKEMCLERGASAFVAKSELTQELLPAIHNAVRSE